MEIFLPRHEVTNRVDCIALLNKEDADIISTKLMYKPIYIFDPKENN